MKLTVLYENLNELVLLLDQLDAESYTKPIAILQNASIGGHMRHIIELFDCLLRDYDSGVVSYDNRKRDKLLETDLVAAQAAINQIAAQLKRPDKALCLVQSWEGADVIVYSNYKRELLYNLEHSIHHQALIRVALTQLMPVQLSDSFGVAPSTLAFRASCAR
ncbi:MAG: hypothetical protein CFE24_09640 [Flavobacterium sp. BFFFF2]|nr:MAG: hypothetical protein CFE24_09640 [Flavobacterium sp. BFFFF2]